ncbi:MAG: chorismate mutase, partial [Acetobacteraceae bacterium]|nr:chorismate mutase [Acetobacteraceae bacterium]
MRALRAELDRIDDAIQDLLIERSYLVSRVGSEGRKAHTPYRPGREAAILRRLLARHSGPLAPLAIVRIWRELVAAGSAVQGGHRLAVYDPDPSCRYVQLAREHFGALAPLRIGESAAGVLEEVVTGAAGVGVLPAPEETERGAWWTALLHERWRTGAHGDSRLYVVAQLPFWSPRPEGAPLVSALAVSRAQPDPSGRDRSLI